MPTQVWRPAGPVPVSRRPARRARPMLSSPAVTNVMRRRECVAEDDGIGRRAGEREHEPDHRHEDESRADRDPGDPFVVELRQVGAPTKNREAQEQACRVHLEEGVRLVDHPCGIEAQRDEPTTEGRGDRDGREQGPISVARVRADPARQEETGERRGGEREERQRPGGMRRKRRHRDVEQRDPGRLEGRGGKDRDGGLRPRVRAQRPSANRGGAGMPRRAGPVHGTARSRAAPPHRPPQDSNGSPERSDGAGRRGSRPDPSH